MSPWLFNLFFDFCVRGLKDINIGVELNGIKVCALMYADDLVLMAECESDLQELVSSVFENCANNGLKMNVSKTKVLVFERDEARTSCKITVENECLEQVNEYVYLGSMFSRDGKCEREIERRKVAGSRVGGALRPIMRNNNVSLQAKKLVHNAILLPSMMYGCETWTWTKREECSINAVEMRSLRRMCGKTLWDMERNENIRKECGMEVSVVTKMKVNKLRWFGHVERMDANRTTKRIYKAERKGVRKRGRPRMTWIEHIDSVLKEGQVRSKRNRRGCMRNGMSVEEAKEVCLDRKEWRSVLSAYPVRDTA
jgi:hypothetical protein